MTRPPAGGRIASESLMYTSFILLYAYFSTGYEPNIEKNDTNAAQAPPATGSKKPRWSLRTLSESSIRLAVERMLLEDKEYFTANAEHVGELVKTGGGVDRAVDEVLVVAEFGSRHLLPMRNLQPLYKTYLVDVYLIYSVILCGAAIILRTFVSLVLSVFQPVAPLEVPKANDQSS